MGRPKRAVEKDGQKFCLHCRQWRPLASFGFQRAKNRYRSECNSCKSEAQKAYYAANRDARRAKSREDYRRHHEKQLERGRRRYERDKEKYKALNHSWYMANKERKAEKVSKWRMENKERFHAIVRKHVRKRRAMKMSAPGSHTQAEWEALKAKYGFKCLSCDRPDSERPLTEDHVIPLVKGGSDGIENIQPLCKPCNSSKSVSTTDYRMEAALAKA